MARAVNYRSLYAVPKETFDAFIKHKTGNFPNVKSLKVNQLNFNDAKHINPQHLGPNGFPTNPRRRGPQVPNDSNDRSQGVSLVNISGDNNERTNEETEDRGRNATADDERRSNNATNNESEERRSNNATEEDAMTLGSVGGGGDDSMSVRSIGGGGNDSMSVGSIGGDQSNGAQQQQQQQGMNLSEEAQLIHNSLNAVPNNLQMARDRQIFNQANESNVLLPRNMGPEFQNDTEHNASTSLQSIGQEDIPANNIVSSTINEASRASNASNPPLSPIIPPNYQLRVPQPGGLLNQAAPIPQPGTPNQSSFQFANSVRNAQPDPSAQSDSSPQFQSQFANSVRNACSTRSIYSSSVCFTVCSIFGQ